MNQFIDPQICTCGNDLARNGGHIHNYFCPYTQKCQHTILRINIQTGEQEHAPCGSRLEPEYACHGFGCPLVELCPHCGTRMDQRGVHNHDCPNNSYTRHYNIFQRFMNLQTPLPRVVDREFVVSDDCSVCLSSFSKCQQVMKPSECKHCFHSHCMMQWIQSENENNRKCPICRSQIKTIFQQELKDDPKSNSS